MKKYLWFLGAVVVFVGVYLIFRSNSENKVLGTHQEATSLPSSSFTNTIDFDFNDQKVTAAWYKVADPFKLTLIANFDQKDEAKTVFDREGCKFLTNGGFYTKDDKPIGLFISEGAALRNFIPNSLADGVLSVNYLTTPRITREVPKDALRIALQTGPFLKENSFFQKLNTTGDKQSRRVIAAVTGENELYFIVFFDKASAYIGPFLNDLPGVLKLFEEKTGVIFADAINLDGGSASAFSTKGFSLSEISPVGSFFCEK